jgi:hypothetical protein
MDFEDVLLIFHRLGCDAKLSTGSSSRGRIDRADRDDVDGQRFRTVLQYLGRRGHRFIADEPVEALEAAARQALAGM